MWRPVLLVLAIWDYTSSQPITEDAESARASQYDFVKCCPCPGSELWNQFTAGKATDGVSSLARANVDDCPCGGQDADSVGAPSLFMPRLAQPVLFGVKTQEEKEESKTLLKPEVNMASGVLETLREATDEEYRDALAREAARDAANDGARDAASDVIDTEETVKPLVTIVINTNADDSISEASQTHEARIAPSDSNLGQAKETIASILKPRNKLFDLDNNASKVHEKVAVLSKGLEGLKLKNDRPIQSLLPGKEKNKLINDVHLKNLRNLNDLGSKLLKNSKDGTKIVTDLGSTNIFDKNTPLFRRITPVTAIKQAKTRQNEEDSSPGPNYIQNQVIDSENKSPFGLKSLLPRKDTSLTNKPLTLSNLLNLKDVELIHSKPLKLNLPTLDLLPIDRNQKAENKKENSNKCNKSEKKAITDVHKTPHTEILDAAPSASVNQPIVIHNEVPESDAEVSKIKDFKTSEEETSTENTMENIPEQDGEANDDRIEIIISGDEGNAIENITIERELNIPDEKLSSGEMEAENILDAFDANDVNQPLVNEEKSEVNEPITNEETDFEQSPDENGDTSQRQSFVEYEDIVDESIEKQDLDGMTSATSNDVFQFESEETEIEDLGFRSGEALEKNDEPVDSGSKETKPKNIDASKELNLQSAESNWQKETNEDQSVETENLKTFPTTNFKLASSEDFEKRAEVSEPEKEENRNIKPSMKELISIKFKTLNQPKTKVLTVSTINKPVEEAKNSMIEGNMPETDSQEHKPDLTILNAENTEDLAPKQPKSIEAAENISTLEAQESVEKNDMSLSASSHQPKFATAIPENVEMFPPEDNLCPCISNAKDASVSQEQDLPIDDNGSGASFRQENIVQPSSLFDGDNVFDRPLLPPLPSLSIRAHIPTLEELNARIPSLLPLDAFARESSKEDSDGDCSEREPTMSSDASTTRSQSSITPLKPLDDINLDIFRVNPLGSPGPLSPKVPSLNLNRFKTRLALPKNLGLKPVELQSSLGDKKNGLLGATLRFGPARIGSRNRGSDILESRLGTLPCLDEVRDTMRSSASNLLNSPHITAKTRLLGSSLPTVETLSSHLKYHADNLKANTENAAKDLQDTLASTLSTARVKSVSIPRTKLAKVEQPNLLEMVSSAHEDVNDKLRAIHLDFTDRLTSLHDNIIQNAKLPKLKIHSAKSTSKLSDMLPLTKTFGAHKKSPVKLKSSLSSSSNKNFQRKPSFKVNRPSQIDHKWSSSPSKSISDQSKSIRPFKLSKAASSLQSKSVNVPKLITASPNSLFTRIPKADGLELRERGPLSRLVMEDTKKQLLKPFRPLGDVKITIETTPRPTSTKLTEKPTKLGAIHMFKERESTTPRTTRPTLSQRIQDAKDSKGFASEVHPSRVPPPTLSRKASKDTKSTVRPSRVTERPKLKTTKKPPLSQVSQTKSVIPKEPATKKVIHHSAPATLKSRLQKPETSSTPKRTTSKTTESPVLAKLREALKARVASKTKAPEKLVSPVRKADQDMLRSASENKAITVVQKDAMKENVTYKCKMMCVKEH